MFVAFLLYRSLNGFQKVVTPINPENHRPTAFDTQEQALAATAVFTTGETIYRDGRVVILDLESGSVVHNTEFKATVPYPKTDDVEVVSESTSQPA